MTEQQHAFEAFPAPPRLDEAEADLWRSFESQRMAWDMHDPYPWQYALLRTISELRQTVENQHKALDAMYEGFRP